MPVGPISCDCSISQIQFGCNIRQLSPLVNVLLVAKYCRSPRAYLSNDARLSPSRQLQKADRIKLNDATDKSHGIDT